MFKPYIMHSNAKIHNSLDSDREIISVDYSSKPRKNVEGDGRNMSSISPPTNKTAAKYVSVYVGIKRKLWKSIIRKSI